MQKALSLPDAATQKITPVGERTIRQAPPDRSGDTFLGAVLFAEIVDYSRRSVTEQLQAKELLNSYLATAISALPPRDRIVLDTGGGAAVTFLGTPEDALLVAANLLGEVQQTRPDAALPLRVGINLGPVRLARDASDQPSCMGDGINVAYRVVSFAQPGQMLVSRSYYDTLNQATAEYRERFVYHGLRTDDQVREHEIFEAVEPLDALRQLTARRHELRTGQVQAAAVQTFALRSREMAWGVAGVGAVTLALAVVLTSGRRQPEPPAVKVAVQQTSQPDLPATPIPEPAVTESRQPAQVVSITRPHAKSPEAKPEPRAPTPTRKGKPAARRGPIEATVAAAPEPQAVPAPQPPSPTEPPAVEPAAAPESTPILPSQYRPTTGPTGLVVLAISPWGEVLVDGEPAGVSPPMTELELPPGKHRIEIRNGAFKPYQTDVDLGPNETARVKHKFQQGR